MSHKVYIYTRVSTNRQAKEGESLNDQEQQCKEVIEKHNANIEKRIDEWKLEHVFREEGKSGGSLKKRDKLQQLLEVVKKNDVVIITKIDRLARNMYDFYEVAGRINEQGANIYIIQYAGFIDEGDSPFKDLSINMLVGVADAERKLIRQRVGEAMQYRRKKGQMTTQSVPFGYRLTEEKKVEIDPDRADFVRWVFKRYDETGSINQVAREANENDEYVKLKQGRKGITVKRGKYGNHNIKAILKNERYTGVYNFYSEKTRKKNEDDKQSYIEDGHPEEFIPLPPDFTSDDFFERIIDQDLFERVQQSLEKNKGQRSGDHVYIFGGLVWDYSNEKPIKMNGSYTSRKISKKEKEENKEDEDVVGPYKKLYNYKSAHLNCDGITDELQNKWTSITEKRLFEIVMEQIKQHYDSSKYEVKKKTKSTSIQRKINKLNFALNDAEKKIKYNKELFKSGDWDAFYETLDEFKEAQKQLKETVNEIKQELMHLNPEEHEREIKQMKRKEKKFNDYSEVIYKYLEEDPQQVKRFFQGFIKRIEIRIIPNKHANSKGGNKDIKVIFNDSFYD